MGHVTDRTGYIAQVHEETLRYVCELLDDNQRQRKALGWLRAQNAELAAQIAGLRRELAARGETDSPLEENATRLAEEFAAIEAQNASLANLYVASFQLHGTVSREGVLQTILEIVSNLVGSEDAAIYELTPDGGALSAVSSMGTAAARWPAIALGSGTVGRAAAGNTIYVAEGGVPGPDGVTAAIPLSVEGRLIGAITVFTLLPQKLRLEEVDGAMFDLLAVHAATALYCATLHERASGGTPA